ncbi:MAG: murein biosynthesis integral membrane protein MurJ, partial [Chloroflexota bacterium]
DVIVAAAFGTQGDYNAYVAAFRIPDLLYLLIIGGALGSALIPVFSRFLGQGEEEKAWRLANAVINSALAAILVVSLLVFFITPQLVTTILAPGFKDQPDLLNKTINLTRLLLLQPILLGLGGIAMALLNGTNHFLWPALAPLFYNTCIILGIIFLSGGWGVYGMAVGVIIGAGVYLLVQIPALVRLGLRYQFTLDWRVPGLSEVFRVLGPRLIGQGVFQFNILITTNLASLISVSSVSGFNYAFQLFMLPHGIFALSVATVTFPAMARLYGAGNLDGLQATFARSLRQIIFFALPSTLGMALLARPVVMMIYQLGQFDNSSTELVSQTLAFFTFGLVAYGVVEIVTRAFYALQDTRSPVIIAVITVGLNIFLSAVLGREQTLATGGLALSLALATNFEMFALLWLLYRKMGTLSGTQERLLAPLLKITLAADIMAAVLWTGLHFLSPVLDETDKVGVILLTLGLIGLGAVTYAGTSLLLGVEELRSAFRRFRR